MAEDNLVVREAKLKEAQEKVKLILETKEDYVRQLALQATILAGFAFTGLTSVSYEGTPTDWRNWFVITSLLAIISELFSLTLAGTLLLYAKMVPVGDNRFKIYTSLISSTYFLGLLAFFLSLIGLAWMRTNPSIAPIIVWIIGGFFLLAMFCVMKIMGIVQVIVGEKL